MYGMTILWSYEALRLCRWGIRSGRCQCRGEYEWQCRVLWILIGGVSRIGVGSAAM